MFIDTNIEIIALGLIQLTKSHGATKVCWKFAIWLYSLIGTQTIRYQSVKLQSRKL